MRKKKYKNIDELIEILRNVIGTYMTIKDEIEKINNRLTKIENDIYRLKDEVKYFDETWRQTREIQFQMSDKLEALERD